ncbi:MAG: GNAT family N-acetyltransferase [Caldithrix sp.]|nr:GNAT family N-acetyltransferase [Caldithrix sp.]
MSKQQLNCSIEIVNDMSSLISSLVNNEDTLQYLSELHQYPEGMPIEMCYAIKHNNTPVGFVCLRNIRWFNRKAELTIYVKNNFRRKGIAHQAIRQMVNRSFNELNLHRLEAEIIAYNQPAIQLFGQFGFKEEGRLREAKYFNGTYHDILRFALLKKEWIA